MYSSFLHDLFKDSEKWGSKECLNPFEIHIGIESRDFFKWRKARRMASLEYPGAPWELHIGA